MLKSTSGKGGITIPQRKSFEKTIQECQLQLNEIFQSNQLKEDYTILKGFVSFVQSKVSVLIEQTFDEYMKLNDASDLQKDTDVTFITWVLDTTWEKIWYPIFKWFQSYRGAILNASVKKTESGYIEMRRLTSKLKKYCQEITDFYMNPMHMIAKRIRLKGLIPITIIDSLKLDRQDDLPHGNLKVIPAVLATKIYYKCVLHIGSLNHHKAICWKFSNNYDIEDFSEALKYFDMSIKLCPTIGDAYFQKGQIYSSINNYCSFHFYNVLGSVVSHPSRFALTSVWNMMWKKNTKLHDHVVDMVALIHNDDLNGRRIVNREIIEYYALALQGYYLNAASWISQNDNASSINGVDVKHMEFVLFERIAFRYMRNIDLIYETTISLIMQYNLYDTFAAKLPDHRTTRGNKKQNKMLYLKFVFGYLNVVIENCIIKSWKSTVKSCNYLTLVKIVLTWIISNEEVLSFASGNTLFIQNLATFLNDVVKSSYFKKEWLSGKITQTFLLEEDVLIDSISFLSRVESIFNDNILSRDLDVVDRFAGDFCTVGKQPDIIPLEMRLACILKMGIILIGKCGSSIKWNEVSEEFIFQDTRNKLKMENRTTFRDSPTTNRNRAHDTSRKDRGVIPRKVLAKPRNGDSVVGSAASYSNSANNSKASPRSASPGFQSFTEKSNNEPVFSGSSVVTPDTFNTRPSVRMMDNKTNQSSPRDSDDLSDTVLQKHENSMSPESSPSVPVIDMSMIEQSLKEVEEQHSPNSIGRSTSDFSQYFNDNNTQTSSFSNLFNSRNVPQSTYAMPSVANVPDTMAYPYGVSSDKDYDSANNAGQVASTGATIPSSGGLSNSNSHSSMFANQQVFTGIPQQQMSNFGYPGNQPMPLPQSSMYCQFAGANSQPPLYSSMMPSSVNTQSGVWGTPQQPSSVEPINGSSLPPRRNLQYPQQGQDYGQPVPPPPGLSRLPGNSTPQQGGSSNQSFYPYANMPGQPQW